MKRKKDGGIGAQPHHGNRGGRGGTYGKKSKWGSDEH